MNEPFIIFNQILNIILAVEIEGLIKATIGSAAETTVMTGYSPTE